MKIAVIGGGWYGCNVAVALARNHHHVSLFEAKPDIFQGASETFANRVHAGPHYPRSAVTRSECQSRFYEFLAEFPEVVHVLKENIYALADDENCRISKEGFKNVCKEFNYVNEIDINEKRFDNLSSAHNVFEPFIYRELPAQHFKNQFEELGITLHTNHKVEDLVNTQGEGIILDGEEFDWVINCTYYQSFKCDPEKLPFDAIFHHEPCLTLRLRPKRGNKNGYFAFTVMDGEYINVTPYAYRDKQLYELHHARYSHLGSFENIEEAHATFDNVTDAWVYDYARPLFENEMRRFYPNYDDEFEYCGFNIGVRTIVKTNTDFRSALVWKEERMVHVFSGKVVNVVQAAEDVLRIVEAREVSNQESTLSRGKEELESEKIHTSTASTGLYSWVQWS